MGEVIHVTGVRSDRRVLAEGQAEVRGKKLREVPRRHIEVVAGGQRKTLIGVDEHQGAGPTVDRFNKRIRRNKIALGLHVEKTAWPEAELLRVQIEYDVAAPAAVLPARVFAAVDDALRRLSQAHVEGHPLVGELVAIAPPIAAQSRARPDITGIRGCWRLARVQLDARKKVRQQRQGQK